MTGTALRRRPAEPNRAPAPELRRRARWGEIELFRIVAALVIVSFHIRQNMAVHAPVSAMQSLHQGSDYPYQNVHWFELFMSNIDIFVDFFFVVSAFLLALPWMRALVNGTDLPSVRAFALGRALRVLPLYYSLVLVIWTLRNHGYPAQWQDLLEHLTFTQWLDTRRIFYTIGPAWSLADEMWLYTLIPLVALLVVRVTRRCRSTTARAITVALPLLGLSAASMAYKYWVDNVLNVPGDHWAWRFGVPAKVDVFCFGMVVALLVTLVGERKMPAPAGILLRACALGGLFWFLSHRVADKGLWVTYAHTAGGAASALLIAAIVLSRPGRIARRLASPGLASVGALTFALYICHESIIDPLTHIGLLKLAPHDMLLNWTFGIPIACALAFVLHHVVEQPATRLRLLWDARGRRQLEHYDEADRLPAYVSELHPARRRPRPRQRPKVAA